MKKIIVLLFIVVPLSVLAQKPSPQLIPYRSKDKFGYCDSSMRLIIPATFDMAEPFAIECNLYNYGDSITRGFGSDQYATVQIKNKKYRIDQSGKIVYTLPSKQDPCFWDGGDSPSHGNIIFAQYGKVGVRGLVRYNRDYRPAPDSIDVLPGDTIHFKAVADSIVIVGMNDTITFIQPRYEEIKQHFPGNRAPFIAKRNGKYGLIDINNKILVPFNYDEMNFLFRIYNLLKVKMGKEIFYIDYAGKEFRDKSN